MESLGSIGDHSSSPEQIHIALATSDSQDEYAMTVAWTTWPETQSAVVWGRSPDSMTNMVEGSSTSEP